MNERVENLKKSFSSILPTLQSNENYTIETANSVFLNVSIFLNNKLKLYIKNIINSKNSIHEKRDEI